MASKANTVNSIGGVGEEEFTILEMQFIVQQLVARLKDYSKQSKQNYLTANVLNILE